MEKTKEQTESRIRFLKENIQYHEDCLSNIATESYYREHRSKLFNRKLELENLEKQK